MQATMPETPAFDAITYKETTRRQWEDAAPAWDRWGPLLERWLGPATERMLDLAGVRPGARVVDVAAGAGGQTLAAARRVGPSGAVLATDIAPKILHYAAAAAERAGLRNVTTLELDGERHDALPPGSFDAAISRLGLIYFPDQHRALTGLRQSLRPGGSFAAIVYATADRNGFFSVPVGIIRQRAGLPPPAAGQPGPFSLGADGVAERALARAGFRDIAVERIDAPVRLSTAAECLRFERESFGALHQMLSGVPAGEREAVWDEVGRALERYQTDEGFVGPCELVVVRATA